MRINFTKKQFRVLIDLIFAGEYLINGHRLSDETIKEYEDLQQYIYSFAKELGYEDLIEFDKEFNMFFETRKYDESGIHELIEEYDDKVFWDELAANLAKRDVANSYKDKIDNMYHTEVLGLVWNREEEYNEEFYENGLDNVKVDF